MSNEVKLANQPSGQAAPRTGQPLTVSDAGVNTGTRLEPAGETGEKISTPVAPEPASVNPNIALVAKASEEAEKLPELPSGFSGVIRGGGVGVVDKDGTERHFNPGQERGLHAVLMGLEGEARKSAFLELSHFKGIGGSLDGWQLGV